MGFRFRRSIKILPGIRLNFGRRGISTSIGVRGAHVTFGRTGTRTTVGLPGSGLSYTHLDKPRRYVSTAGVTDPAHEASPGSALRGFLWMGLIATVLVSAIARMMVPPQPKQIPASARSPAEITERAADQRSQERLAEVKTATLGVAQIRHSIANSNTLRVSRVAVMPRGTICYQFHLRNSRGIPYARSAIMEGAVLKVSGSPAFAATWNSRCALKDGRDITAEVEGSSRP